MCYDFDAYLAKARIVEQMRTKKPIADQREKERAATAPSAPPEESRDKDRKPVPA